jgi:hypothetical protein
LITFVGPRPTPSHQCRHLDGNPLNNAVENLVWGTRLENAMDKIKHGTSGKGVANSCAKLSEQDARELRARYLNGENRRKIAREYGVCRTTVRDIGTGRRWSHLI